MSFYKIVLAGLSAFGLYSGLQAAEGNDADASYLRELAYMVWPTGSGVHQSTDDATANSTTSAFGVGEPADDRTYEARLQETSENMSRALYDELQNPESRQELLDRIDSCIERHPEHREVLEAYKRCLTESASAEELSASLTSLSSDYPTFSMPSLVVKNGRVEGCKGIWADLLPGDMAELMKEVNEMLRNVQ